MLLQVDLVFLAKFEIIDILQEILNVLLFELASSHQQSQQL